MVFHSSFIIYFSEVFPVMAIKAIIDNGEIIHLRGLSVFSFSFFPF